MQTRAIRSTLGTPPRGEAPSSDSLAEAAVAAVAPASHVRVVDACGEEQIRTGAYLEVGARVIRLSVAGVDAPAARGSYHAVVALDSGQPPRGVRFDDADLVLWDGAQDVPLTWLATRLAAGGTMILPESAGPSARACGLDVSRGPGGLAIARDPRPAAILPAALHTLDRTMSVDRPAVLQALRAAPFVGPCSMVRGEPEVVRAQSRRLQEALSAQLQDGSIDANALPWPTHTTATSGVPGCDVLVVLPHPDDETIYLGGTIAALRLAGQSVHLIVATDGGAGRGGGDDLAQVRAKELLGACARLGIASVATLGWPDTGKYRDRDRTVPLRAADAIEGWGGPEALARLVAVIREHRPRTVLGLDPNVDPNLSLHGHHLGLGVLLAVAFHLAADPAYAADVPAWACADHRVATASFLPAADDAPNDTFAVDRAAKADALAAYASQAYSTRRLVAALADDEIPCREATRRVQARSGTPWLLAVPEPAGTPESDDSAPAWREHAARVARAPRDRETLVALMAAQLKTISQGPDAAALRSLQTLRRPEAVVVVAGQQVGWLGGPAYALTKALAAVALARRLQRQGIAAVPVFWMATQDHDALEVCTAPRLGARAVRAPMLETRGPVGAAVLSEAIEDAIESWAAGLPEAIAGAARTLAQRHYVPGRTYAQAFGSLLCALTGGTGLLVLDPADARFAALARPVYERELLGPESAATPLRASEAQAIVPVDRDVSQVFFVDDDGVRQRLRRTERGVVWRGGQMRREVLEQRLAQSPERFSPAALLRPVVQDLVLPAVATIAGPTERLYLAQMRGLYPWAQIAPSAIVPRPLLHPVQLQDLAALEPCGGLDALRTDPKPYTRIGRAGLSGAATRWLSALEQMMQGARDEREVRRRGASGVRSENAAVEAGLAALEEGSAVALAGLRTRRSWPDHHRALCRLVLDSGEGSTRALTRIGRRLHQLRRSLLRDGRRAAASAVEAWARCGGSPEREQTCVEFVARFGERAPAAVLAALQHPQLSSGGTLHLYGGGRGC